VQFHQDQSKFRDRLQWELWMRENRSNFKLFYDWTRLLHFYFGLFISPFLVIFSVSTIMLNHGWKPVPQELVSTVSVQIDESLKGAQLVSDLTRQLDLRGEVVGNGKLRDNKTSFFVMRPGATRRVVVDMATRQAEITFKTFGFFDTLRYLHMNPGPHKPSNWFFGKMWGWLADTTVYLTLFLTVSGIYMWVVLKAERRIGLLALGAGCLSFGATTYALLF
jgi:hypothetical protein